MANPGPEIQTTLRRGTVWVSVASGLSGTTDLISTLACLWLWISPSDFGVATLATALFAVFDRIAMLGLGSAIVQRETATPRELSSIWWLALSSSVLLLALTLATRGWIGAAFGYPIVGTLVCAYAGKLVIQTAFLVPEALLRRELAFVTISKLRIVGILVETGVKLGTAYWGAHGHPDLRIWCFVAGLSAGMLTMLIGYQLVRPWRPQLVFDSAVAKAAARFGIHVSLADVVFFAYTNADYVVVGSAFGAAAVGTYRIAYEVALDVVRLVSMINAEIAFPTFARLAGDSRAVGEQLLAMTRQNLMMVAPVIVVIGVAAADVLAILYPPLPDAATTAVRILCIVGALRSVSFVLPAMLAGLGHARDALVYNVVAAIICPTAFAIAAAAWPGGGYLSVAWAWAAAYPLAFAILVWFALQRTHVRLRDYARHLLPVVAWSLATAAVALAAYAALPSSSWLRLIAVASVTAASFGAFWHAGRVRRRLAS